MFWLLLRLVPIKPQARLQSRRVVQMLVTTVLKMKISHSAGEAVGR